jgi:carbon-monoxide dehydrogenase medium subunit
MEAMDMYPNDFEYASPTTIEEAVRLLQTNEDAKVLAGGHSLLPLMKTRLASPAMLVDIGRIPELRQITVNGGISIGAMATYHEVAQSAELKQHCPILADAIHNIGDAQVRNRGTLGGALAHADPAADMTAVILALGGAIKAQGPNGTREISIDDFFVDMLQTGLEQDELLTAISIPAAAGRTGMAYEKFKHPASGYAIVGVAAVVQIGDAGVLSHCRVAVTGAGPKPQRATQTENMLTGQQPSAENIAAAAEQASAGLELLSDISASEEFRAHLVRVHARRAIERAVASAG